MISKSILRFVILCFSVLLVYPSVQRIIVLVDFELNKDYISEFLCIEKDIEESTCNGQCHLKDELRKVEKSDSHSKKNVVTKQINLFYIQKDKTNELIHFFTKNEKTISNYSSSKPCNGFLVDLDKPPQT